MKVNIKLLDASTHTVDGVEPTTTVKELKALVAAKVGLAPPQQRLILKGKVLVDDKTMQESGVQDSFVIHLVERPAASSAASSSSSGAAGPAAQPEPQPQQQQQGDFVTSFQVSGPNAIQNVGSLVQNLLSQIIPQVAGQAGGAPAGAAGPAPAPAPAPATAAAAAAEGQQQPQGQAQQPQPQQPQPQDPAVLVASRIQATTNLIHLASNELRRLNPATPQQPIPQVQADPQQNVQSLIGMIRELNATQQAMQPLLGRLETDLANESSIVQPAERVQTQHVLTVVSRASRHLAQAYANLPPLLQSVQVAGSLPGQVAVHPNPLAINSMNNQQLRAPAGLPGMPTFHVQFGAVRQHPPAGQQQQQGQPPQPGQPGGMPPNPLINLPAIFSQAAQAVQQAATAAQAASVNADAAPPAAAQAASVNADAAPPAAAPPANPDIANALQASVNADAAPPAAAPPANPDIANALQAISVHLNSLTGHQALQNSGAVQQAMQALAGTFNLLSTQNLGGAAGSAQPNVEPAPTASSAPAEATASAAATEEPYNIDDIVLDDDVEGEQMDVDVGGSSSASVALPDLPAHSLTGVASTESWIAGLPEAERAMWGQTLAQDKATMQQQPQAQQAPFSDFYELSHSVADRRNKRKHYQTATSDPSALFQQLVQDSARSSGVALPAGFFEIAQQQGLPAQMASRAQQDAAQRLARLQNL